MVPKAKKVQHQFHFYSVTNKNTFENAGGKSYPKMMNYSFNYGNAILS
jgi:hypothetical protein